MGQIGIKKLETDIQTRNDLCVTHLASACGGTGKPNVLPGI